MQAPLDIRYAGVNIGRAQEVRTAEGEATFFLPGKEPMPVGTVLRLRTGTGETPARVMRAIESTDPAVCGMEVRIVGDEEAVAAEVIPPPAPARPKPSPPPPAPVQPAPSPAPPAPVEPAASTPTQPYGVATVAAEADKLPAAAPPALESSAVPEAVPVAVGSSLTGALTKATADTDPADAPTPPSPELPMTAAAAPTRTREVSDDLDIVISNTPPPISPASVVPVVAPFEGDPTPPPPPAETAAPAAEAAGEGSQASTSTNGNGNGGEEAPASEASPTTEQLPTARAISGPSSRRKTKRRRSS